MKRTLTMMITACLLLSSATAFAQSYKVRGDTQYPDEDLQDLTMLQAATPHLDYYQYENGSVYTNIAAKSAVFSYGTSAVAVAFGNWTNTSVTAASGLFHFELPAALLNTNGTFWYTILVKEGSSIFYSGKGDLTIIETTVTGNPGAAYFSTLIDWALSSYTNTATDGPNRPDGSSLSASTNADGSLTWSVAVGAGADHLGNHLATSNLNMAGNAIVSNDWGTTAVDQLGVVTGGQINAGTTIDGTDAATLKAAAVNGLLAYTWGDHGAAGYAAETSVATISNDLDALEAFYATTSNEWATSIAKGITSTDSNEWATAYGWGDHGAEGYIKDDGSVPMAGDLDMGGQAVTNMSGARITDGTVFGGVGLLQISANGRALGIMSTGTQAVVIENVESQALFVDTDGNEAIHAEAANTTLYAKATAPDGVAAHLEGNLRVTGTVTVGTNSFQMTDGSGYGSGGEIPTWQGASGGGYSNVATEGYVANYVADNAGSTDLSFYPTISQTLGRVSGAWISYTSADLVSVQEGHGWCGTNYWLITNAISHSITSGTASAYTYIYVSADSSWPTPTIHDRTNVPTETYDGEKAGFYSGDDQCIHALFSCSTSAVIHPFVGSMIGGEPVVFWKTSGAGGWTRILNNGAPDGTLQAPDTESDTMLPVNASAAGFRMTVVDTGARATGSIFTFEEADYGSAGYSTFTVMGNSDGNKTCRSGWKVLGDSKKIRWSGENDDDNSTEIFILGYIIRRL